MDWREVVLVQMDGTASQTVEVAVCSDAVAIKHPRFPTQWLATAERLDSAALRITEITAALPAEIGAWMLSDFCSTLFHVFHKPTFLL